LIESKTSPSGRIIAAFKRAGEVKSGLTAGETTEYQAVPNGVYSYAAYELTVNGEKTDLPVIDWVGAEPMPGEAFTYVLELNPEAGRWEMLQVVEVKTDR
jgi:hypothetical protein